ncbi:MAG: hypothetical protein ACK4SA_09575 [Caldilinea sp.]
MTHQTLATPQMLDIQTAFPLLRLLNPKQHTRLVLALLLIGLIISYLAVAMGWLPLWGATALTLVVLLPAGVLKWRDDCHRYGATIMGLSILATAQGLHTVEHLVQWTQYHLFYLTMRQSNGLLSPANAEWVHFVWNWLVLIAVVALMFGGMRGVWMWLLLVVAAFHTIEHSYTFIRYQMILRELTAMDVLNVTAQGLPGIVGRDGWLARSEWTRGTWICTIPGLTTAVRLDVHFWWNAIEMTFLALAGHFYLRKHFSDAA